MLSGMLKISRYLQSLIGCRDAWAKHRDLDPLEAKWLYVDALLKARNKSMLEFPL